MRVLLVHQAFVARDEPGGTRHLEFGARLAAAGDQLTVVASQVSYLTGRRVRHGSWRLIERECSEGVEILRAYAPAVTHRGYGWRVFGFVLFALTSIVAGLRAGPVDLVMGTSPPMPQAVSAWAIARIRRVPFLLEIRDLWPEFAIEMGVLRHPALKALAWWLQRFLYRRADHLLVNSPAYRHFLERRGVEPERISCIPNGVDPAVFQPDSRGEAVRTRYGLENKVAVVYSGALGAANDLDTLVSAAALCQDDPALHFLLVGDGKERVRLEADCRRRGLGNVTFVGQVPKERMPEMLAATDICVATLLPIPLFATTYPNKVFDYMAAGRPVVLAIDGVIREVVEAAGAGLFVQPGDPDALAEALRRLSADPAWRAQMGSAARRHVMAYFNRDEQAEAFRALARGLVQRSRRPIMAER